MRVIITLMLCAGAEAYGQSANSRPAFEVASVKPSAPPDGRPRITASSGGPGTDDPSRITIQNYMLLGLVAEAYQVATFQVSGPGWLEDSRETQFDIRAKVPDGTTKEQVPLMMQNLLAERFHLTFHREKKEGNVYELVVAKNGPKLKASTKDPAPQNGREPPSGPPKLGPDGFPALPPGRGYRMAMMNDRASAQFTDGSMSELAGLVAGQLGRPVTDATQLRGKYEFTLRWSMQGLGKPGDDPGPTLFVALQEQLGLKLEQKKGMIDMIVIDHIDKVPTDN
jgi:uncharacterized protein (TIGR03435 family)